MEFRKVTIINNKTQSQKVIQASSAVTLGELKREMREANIEYEGMTFFEGHVRAELKDDSSILPTNIPYKGEVVNDLIFLLTAPEKKIRSGAMSRTEVLNKIKAKGLQGECMKKFGKNFTTCKTQDLLDLLGKSAESAPVLVGKRGIVKQEETKAPQKETSIVEDKIVLALEILLKDLWGSGTIDESIYIQARTVLEGITQDKSGELSKREVDDMFDFALK